MSLLLDALFNSVAYGHLIVDVLNGQRSVLLTYWSSELGLSNTALALISTIYVWVASLSQPVFGWITDRFGKSRLMAAGGILWMCSLFSLALFMPVHFAIPCLILASLGSAAFHPAGVMQATLRGRTHLERRETTAASWLFLFGQLGYFFGPIIGGPLLTLFGPTGLLILAALGLPIGLNTAWQLRKTTGTAILAPKSEAVKASRPVVARSFLVALALIAALQAWAQQNMITFVPKYLSDMGKTAAVYGLIAGLFMGGSAIGNVIGGSLADRFSKQRVAMSMLALASIPLFLVSILGWSPWLYLLVPLSGMFTGAVHSIIVVLAQRTIRGGMALASGLTLGFMFSAGALGTLLSGPLADGWGFPPVFQMTAGLVILASLLTLFLREPVRGSIPTEYD
ncbi:MAG: MFS transporter [Anaerolineales bacterium]|nr:MFS transporter [Anaerolineales bacterium]